MSHAKDKLKILLLSYRGNPYCGGQGIYLQYLAQELGRLGHQVHVLVGPPYPIFMDGAKVHRVKNNVYFGSKTRDILGRTQVGDLLKPIHFYEYASSRFGVFPEIQAFSFRAYFKLLRLLKKERYDIIHDNQCLGYGFLLMKHFGIPFVSTIHHPLTIDRAVWFEQTSTLKAKVKRLLYYPLYMQKVVANRLDGIVTVSQDSAARINEDFQVPLSKIRVVYNGLNAGIFRPLENVPKKEHRLIFVGNTADPKKGVEYLLKAMPMIKPEAQLVIVDGGAPPHSPTARLIDRYNLHERVHITGKIGQDELVKWYCSASVAVVPSLYEGFGFPAAEAMACELPVVATTAGALPEVVGEDGQAGLLTPPRNPEALASAVNSLLDDAEARQRLGANARQRVLEIFTWSAAATQLADYYQEVIRAYR